ncbi:MAG: TRAP transporter substrate-binding protein DctP [Clostridia bacterium]|nr:TRAP transporter substrate-binding protein DctP [Clostridia bacterium]
MKRFLSLVLICLLIISLAACASKSSTSAPASEATSAAVPQAEVIKWRMQACEPTGSIMYNYSEYFARLVKEASGGRLDITVYAPDSLYPVLETLSSVGKGVSEMAACYGSFYKGLDPACMIEFCAPYSFNDYADMYIRCYDMGVIDIMREVYEKQNVYLADYYFIPPENLFSKKPIKTAEDLKGLKVRVGGIAGDVFTKLGAAVTTVTASEIYTALQLGTIDAAEFSGYSMNYDLGFQEVTKYITPQVHHGTCASGFWINMDEWNALPEDIKAIIHTCAKEAGLYAYTSQVTANHEALKKMLTENKLEMVPLPDEELAKILKAAEEVENDYAAASPAAAKIVEIERKLRQQKADLAKLAEG